METKTCSKCKTEKPLDQYHRHKLAKGGRESACRICRCADQRKYFRNNREKKMLADARRRAKQYNLPFDIELEDIIIPETCPYLHISIQSSTGSSHDNSPTLDRIVPSMGYTRDNIIIVSNKANRMKSNATPEELLILAGNIQKIMSSRQGDHHPPEGGGGG